MLLADLRHAVMSANQELVRHGIVMFTFGNVSAIARAEGLVAIKPSGVPYEELTPEKIVVCDLEGRIVEGALRPSSDLPTHLVLYRNFPRIGGVAHTHSEYATAWAQAQRPIPCLGTTHADYFHRSVPLTAPLSAEAIAADYERATGDAICRAVLADDAEATPAVLVAGHAPFCWGRDAADAVHTAVALEYVARLAAHTLAINPDAPALPRPLHDKHFFRKHGPGAYYGQAPDR